jgi:hypothetical protein
MKNIRFPLPAYPPGSKNKEKATVPAAVPTTRSTVYVCHSEWTWACGPPIEMKINAVVTPAQAGVHLSPGEGGFPLARE